MLMNFIVGFVHVNIFDLMKKDRSDWTVKKFASFAEADQADNEYYASLSEVERLEILISLRSMIVPPSDKIEKIVLKKTINELED